MSPARNAILPARRHPDENPFLLLSSARTAQNQISMRTKLILYAIIAVATNMTITGAAGAEVTPQASDDLESLFLNPPDSAKPYVWWHWMGSNFSKYGITRDLEAMKAAGIGGATVFNISSAVQESHAPTKNNPWPEQTYRSAAYWEALRFAAAEADRLGLEIGLHNTVGYATTGGPWIDEERGMQHLVWSDTLVTGGSRLSLELKKPEFKQEADWGQTGRAISFYKDIAVLAVPADQKEISPGAVIQISSSHDHEGRLEWNAPPGKWKVYRMGHAATGAEPHPVPDELIGKVLEVDKMSAEQNAWHWMNVIDPVKAHLGEHIGKSFRHMLIDSYEAGRQNWTPDFREQFIKRKGYDPVPWLVSFSPTVTGGKPSKDRRVIDGSERTARFDWDYRDVINQLFFENGWEIGKRMLNDAGLELQFEPYTGPFNTPQGAAMADIPMAEFWTSGTTGVNPAVVAAARAAGKNVIGAEAYTGRPEVSQYTEDPAFLKPSTDMAFAQGINRMILHHWVHQPFDDKYQPGMGMGWWGTHFSRHQTWFEPGKSFFDYLSRCQAMLQYGEPPTDMLSVGKPDADTDLLSPSDFLTMDIRVENGRVALPGGRSYAILMFPEGRLMLPETARKLESLVAAGAMVVSPKPVSSPSLSGFPECDHVVRRIGNDVWGANPSNQYGRGFVFTRKADAVAKAGIKPGFQVLKAAAPEDIRIVHRQSSSSDVFFVANLSDNPQHAVVSFRIDGRQPELWHAEHGSIAKAPVWNSNNGRTSVQLCLKGNQSVFVVFRQSAPAVDHPVEVTSGDPDANWWTASNANGNPVIRAIGDFSAEVTYASGRKKSVKSMATAAEVIDGPWHVTFVPKLDQAFELEFPELVDFAKHPDISVNYFAGTATYRKSIRMPVDAPARKQRTVLDLGDLHDIAELRLNGRSAGVLWYPPYAADVTDFLQPGDNTLEIMLTTNWANRLIGDEQHAADFEWGEDRGPEMGRAMLGYPDWFAKKQQRPSQGRKTFSVWYYYRQDSALKPAGLLGPVRLVPCSEIDL
jgi:hypothetical protein